MRRLPYIVLALFPLPLLAHGVVDLGIRFQAPQFVAAGSTARIDVIVSANAYDDADDVTLTIFVRNATVASADEAWECTPEAELIVCHAEEVTAGPHPVILDVSVPSNAATLPVRATVEAGEGEDPREDNNDVATASRVFDRTQCQQSAPQPISDLQWTASAGATSYEVFYGVDGEAMHLLSTTSATRSPILTPGGDVTWFVRAHFDGCPALDSATASFHSSNPALRLAIEPFVNSGLIAPHAAAVDGATVYVTDPPAHALYRVDTDSHALTPVSLLGDIVADPPHLDGGIIVGPGSFLYVADSGTHTLRFVDTTGNMYFIAGQPRESGTLDGQGANARFESPAAVAVTIDGKFYVTDRAANVVRKLKYNGEEFDFDVETFAREDLLEPAGIAVDDSGRVYVADRGNHVIRTIDENGVISTYAGTTGVAGYRDGDVTTALFNRPNGIAIDAFGNIYVSEEANGDIRKIAPNGRVTTVANGLRRPGLFTIAEDGTFWIPDTGNGRLLRGTSSLPERRRGVRH